jgi:hypothetical protein
MPQGSTQQREVSNEDGSTKSKLLSIASSLSTGFNLPSNSYSYTNSDEYDLEAILNSVDSDDDIDESIDLEALLAETSSLSGDEEDDSSYAKFDDEKRKSDIISNIEKITLSIDSKHEVIPNVALRSTKSSSYSITGRRGNDLLNINQGGQNNASSLNAIQERELFSLKLKDKKNDIFFQRPNRLDLQKLQSVADSTGAQGGNYVYQELLSKELETLSSQLMKNTQFKQVC